jgi:formylmethanofuran dehydrogenase subunit B
MPRFFERVVWPEPLPVPARRLVFVGAAPPASAKPPPAGSVTTVPCAPERLLDAAAALRTLVEARRLPGTAEGLPLAELGALAAELRRSRYGIVTWATGDFPTATAELTVFALAELLKSLNATTRALGLPLAGPGNVIGANQVTGWSWGTPIRSSVATGAPDYDPEAWSAATLIATGTADAQLWISSFEAKAPPTLNLPTVALVRSGTRFEREPEVVIPVATPGLDHPGSIFRTDSVVALPLQGLRTTDLPSTADVLQAIERRVSQERRA